MFHTRPADQVLAELKSSAQGLDQAEAEKRLAATGLNVLSESKRFNLLFRFLHQFRSPLIYLLLIAAAIALAIGEPTDAAVVVCVVLLNALIGIAQEYRAERALEALRKFSLAKSQVLRNGSAQKIDSKLLVPGDVLVLQAGDAVMADGRLLEAKALGIAEAALTGESQPVHKNVEVLAEKTPLAERHNMVFAGTFITAGRGLAVVVATGAQSEFGKIAELTKSKHRVTPLQRRVDKLSQVLAVVAIAFFAAIMLIGILRQIALPKILMVGITQLVSVVPEGLPVVMTIGLALGVQRMARHRAIVRRLSAVEALGSTNVICVDKTGTLTRNEMTVVRVVLGADRAIDVSSAHPETSETKEQSELETLLTAAVLCNDAQPESPTKKEQGLGDPTEVALLQFAKKFGVDVRGVRERYPREAEEPFSPESKWMITQHRDPDEGSVLLIKGALEVVLGVCSSVQNDKPLDKNTRDQIFAHAAAMAQDALRVLAFAHVKKWPGGKISKEALGTKAVFLGLVGQIDPLRDEAKESIAQCKKAGIRVLMLTGDHRTTATAIGRTLGIVTSPEQVLDGSSLDEVGDQQLSSDLQTSTVVSRVQPEQKLRIVKALQAEGAVVAMTGDGVNDAPALSHADVGVAMGKVGTEVAKESADIVLTDDNFATLVHAVREGRVVYRNLQKALLLLLSTGVAEICILFSVVILGLPLPFAAVQILWNNVITESTITLNLAAEPPEGDEMRRAPLSRNEPLVNKLLLLRIGLISVTITLLTLGYFIYRRGEDIAFARVQTASFTLLAVCEWYNVLNCRSEKASALGRHLFSNPWLWGSLLLSNALHMAVVFWPPLNRFFHTVPLTLSEVVSIGVWGSLVLWVEEIRKLWVRNSSLRQRGLRPSRI